VPPRHPEAEAEAPRPEPRRNDPQPGEVRAPQPAAEPAAVRPEVAAEPVRREPETSREEDAAAETTHSKRDWGRIFKRAIEKINDGFNAAEDEEI
jgi:cell division protein FtsA